MEEDLEKITDKPDKKPEEDVGEEEETSESRVHIPFFDIDPFNCYVATKVYGNPNAPQVQILREFRDNVLRKSPAGRLGVSVYYNGIGRAGARILRAIPIAARLSRSSLNWFTDHIQY